MKGWIKDYRKEINSDVWLMPPLYHRVWQYLKYKVNHKEKKIPMRDGTFLTIRPGQHLTSVRNISNDVGWYERGVFKSPNPKTVSSVLEWLEQQGMIKIERGKGNRQYSLITLLNWDSYQSIENESNSKETVSKQSLDINKNGIENEKEKRYISLSFDDDIFLEIYNNQFVRKYEKPHMMVSENKVPFIKKQVIEMKSKVDIEEFELITKKHFDNLPSNNDGNFLAFIQAFPRYLKELKTDDIDWD